MSGVEEGGVHPHGEPAVAALSCADQLEPEAELAGVGEIVALEVLDALEGDVLEAHGRAEGEAREDGHLGGGVLARNVFGGVGLGVTLKLSLS